MRDDYLVCRCDVYIGVSLSAISVQERIRLRTVSVTDLSLAYLLTDTASLSRFTLSLYCLASLSRFTLSLHSLASVSPSWPLLMSILVPMAANGVLRGRSPSQEKSRTKRHARLLVMSLPSAKQFQPASGTIQYNTRGFPCAVPPFADFFPERLVPGDTAIL